MPAKRPKKFSKIKQVKAIARKRAGSPKSSRILDERSTRTKPKYKENWLQEAGKHDLL